MGNYLWVPFPQIWHLGTGRRVRYGPASRSETTLDGGRRTSRSRLSGVLFPRACEWWRRGRPVHFATAEDGLQLHYWRETFLTPPAPSVPDVSEGLHRIKRSASAVPTRTIRISQEPRNVHHHPRNHATGGPAAGWDGPPKGFIGRRAANCRRRNAAGMP